LSNVSLHGSGKKEARHALAISHAPSPSHFQQIHKALNSNRERWIMPLIGGENNWKRMLPDGHWTTPAMLLV